MAKDAVLRSSLLFVGAAMVLVGICTLSFKKMVVTYLFGTLAVAGVVLPDWEFFDRGFSQWFLPMRAERGGADSARTPGPQRFKVYPLRVALLIMVYSFGLYKWWNYISS